MKVNERRNAGNKLEDEITLEYTDKQVNMEGYDFRTQWVREVINDIKAINLEDS